VLRDYAPVPGTLIPGRAAALHVDSFWREVSLLFHHRRNKLMPLVQQSDIAAMRLMVREQAVTAGLSPMRSRTSQPEGCFYQEKYPSPITTDRVKIPRKVRSGFRQHAKRLLDGSSWGNKW
jgi:hypothetical protein